MTDTKISALTELAETPASTDEFVVVDKSVTTMAASGTDKRLKWQRIASYIDNGQIVDVNRVYGAVGDGSNDDTTALQAAFTDLNAGTIAGLIFPGKHYVTTSTLAITDQRNLYLLGAGHSVNVSSAHPETRISKAGTSTTTDHGVLQIVSCQHFTVEGIHFDITGATGALCTVEITASDSSVTNRDGYSSLSSFGGKFKQCMFARVASVPPGAGSVYAHNVLFTEFESCTFDGDYSASTPPVSVRLGENAATDTAKLATGQAQTVAFKHCHFFGDIERRFTVNCTYDSNFFDRQTGFAPAVLTTAGDKNTINDRVISNFIWPGSTDHTRTFYLQGDNASSGGVHASANLIQEVLIAFDFKAVRGGVISQGNRFQMTENSVTAHRIASGVTGPVMIGANDYAGMTGSGTSQVTDSRTSGYPANSADYRKDGTLIARRTVNDDSATVTGGIGTSSAQGARLQLFGGTHASQADNAYMYADEFVVKEQAGTTTYLDVHPGSSFAAKDAYDQTQASLPNVYVGSGGQIKRATTVPLASSDIGSSVQAYDADLTTLGALGSGARTALGLAIGTDVQAYDADLTTLGALGSGARTALGLAIGTDVQAYDADLTTAAGMTAAQASALATYRNSIVLGSSGAQVSDAGNTTNETDAASITVPAGVMGSNGSIEVWATFSYTNSSNVKTARIRFGGISGTIYRSVAPTTTALVALYAHIQNRNATGSQIGATTTGAGTDGGTSSSVAVTSSVNTALQTTVDITTQKATGTETMNLERYLVLLHPTA